MKSYLTYLIAAISIAAVAELSSSAHAAPVLSFGGYNWDQANAPNIGTQLGSSGYVQTVAGTAFNNGNLSNVPANFSRTNDIFGFVEGQPGANTGVGYLSRFVDRVAGVAGPLELSGTKGINLPTAADIGSANIRGGIEVGWAAGTNGIATPVLANGSGADFVIWESGSANRPDALMTRVRLADSQAYSDWFFVTPISNSVSGSVLWAYAYNLDMFGLASGETIDLIQFANMNSKDRINAQNVAIGPNGYAAQGQVLVGVGTPGVYGTNNPGPDPGNITPPYGIPFGGGTYDPDPLYVSILHNLQDINVNASEEVPEPASLALWGIIGSAGAIAAWRKRNRLAKQA
ncbi:MAG TPA: hypothetical protein VL096_09050 [Pirellulaceae bacterium]|nr:hypothetical protein [Pirellulaceae bacterium]